MQHCQRVDVQDALYIETDIGTEGWAALGKALSVGAIYSNKEDMASARTEDLEVIWEGVTGHWQIWLDEDRIELFEKTEWTEFKQFLKAEEDVKEDEEDNVLDEAFNA